MTEIRTSEQIEAVAAAIAKAQSELENVERGGTNPHFRSRYAQLGSVLDEVRPKFAKHGIAILQHAVNGDASRIGIVTRLAHSSGQWMESSLYIGLTRCDAQATGSAISYLRRYALMAITGIGADDDDGEAAVGRPQEQPRSTSHTTTRVAVQPAPPVSPVDLRLTTNPEEGPEVIAARQRTRMLIDKYDHLIKTAPDAAILAAAFDAGQEEITEIEGAGERGKEAGQALRRKYMARMARLETQAA